MMHFQYFLVVAGLLQWTNAQSVTLSPCASMCLNNMAAQANWYGCALADLTCLCQQENWGYGVRDCARYACDTTQAQQALSFIISCKASAASRIPPQTSMIVAVTSTVNTTPGATRLSPASSTSVPTAASPSSLSSASGSTGLSTGSKIGLAAGLPCAVIVIAIAVLAGFCFGKRRSGMQSMPTQDSGVNQGYRQGQHYEAAAQYAAYPVDGANQVRWQGEEPQRPGINRNEERGHE